MTYVTITSDLDAAMVAELRSLFETVAGGNRDVTIDLSSATFIDPSGIGALAFLYKRLMSRGRRLMLVGVQAQPRLLLRKLRLSALLMGHPATEAA